MNDLEPLIGVLGTALVLVVAAILVMGFGLWFGMTRLSPRIQRRLDRDESEQESAERRS